MEPLLNFISENQGLFSAVSALVAFVALFRPEITALFKRLLNKIEFYAAGLIEIGFFDYGPTIGIQGTLRALKSDQFIKSMGLSLTRIRDSATYKYSWAVFREMDYIQIQNSKFHVASAFNIQINNCKPLNILFADTSTKERYIDEIHAIRTKFQDFMNEQGYKFSDATQLEKGRAEFRIKENDFIRDVYTSTATSFYWQEGEYLVELTIQTDGPSKNFSFKYKFFLSKKDIDSLDLNRICLIEAALFEEARPNFSNLVFEKVS